MLGSVRMLANQIKRIVFASLLFLSLAFFFIKFYPVSIFDTDDWINICFFRKSTLLPSVEEWNPIKILPENLMPLVCFSTNALRVCSFYDSCLLGMSFVLALFVSLFVITCMWAVSKLFDLSFLEETLIGLGVLFICLGAYIPLIKRSSECMHFFHAMNATNVFHYTIPTILNAVLIFLAIIYEDILKNLFSKKHLPCKCLYLIFIYFAVYSNLYSNIVLASYAAVKILQYLFETRCEKFDFMSNLKQCAIYLYVLFLWFISLFFEAHGGRAKMAAGVPLNLLGALKELVRVLVFKNIVFNILLFFSVLFYIVLLVHVLRNKSFYLGIMKCSKTSETKNKDIDVFTIKYVNYTTLCLLCASLTMAFIVLLSAKTGTGYITRGSVQLDYYVFMIMNILMIFAYIMKRCRRGIYGIAVVIAIFICMVMFHRGGVSYI